MFFLVIVFYRNKERTMIMEFYLYNKIARKLKERVLSGFYQPGSKLPSIRTLAKQEGVNTATIYRSLYLLRKMDLIVCSRGNGYYVTSNHLIIKNGLQEVAQFYVKQILIELHNLGYSDTEIKHLLKSYISHSLHKQ